MIFESITNAITDGKTKFLVEKIQVYTRLLELWSQIQRHPFDVNLGLTPSVIEELKNIGIINNASEIALLQKTLSHPIFTKLISAVSYFLEHPESEKIILNLRNLSRKRIQSSYQKVEAPTVADFFCGAGGLSCGFVQAGFKIVFANEIQDVCCETYKYNHPELDSSRLFEGDIRTIVDRIDQFIPEQVDIVVGGPPCQGFSSANKQRVIDDPRNELYKFYLRAIERLCPKIVLMENVRGMLEVADQVVEDYRAIKSLKDGKEYSYDVSYKLLNSQNFSVAQSRERLIYIAVRNDIATTQGISPETIFSDIENACFGKTIYNLSEVLEYIQPLEAPRIKGMTETDDEQTGWKIGINKFSSLGNHYLQMINQNIEFPFVFNHKARYCSNTNYEIFKRLNQGDNATDPKIADIMPYAHRNHCFKDKYFRLVANRPCRTITAHMKMDCLSHIHPFQTRSLTPREAARVQSFPDSYMFLGAYLKTYMQIGNAVPVLMAKTIAEVLKRFV